LLCCDQTIVNGQYHQTACGQPVNLEQSSFRILLTSRVLKVARVLITGIAGFVGKYLTQHLQAQGHQLFGFDQTSLSPNLMKGITVYPGDICDVITIKNALSEVQPEIIYHLAGILKSTEVQSFYRVNVLGTLALFE